MGTRARTRQPAAAKRNWKRIVGLAAVPPVAALWGYSIIRSAGQALAPFGGEGVLSAPALAAASRPGPLPAIAGPPAAMHSGASSPAADAAPSGPLPGADGARVDAGDDDADAVPELHSTVDMLPLFAEYLREADAAQALELVQTLAEFLPTER
jgi:hypothetical protein